MVAGKKLFLLLDSLDEVENQSDEGGKETDTLFMS